VRQTLYQKAKLLSDVKVGTVKEFRKFMGPDWTGKRGDALLVLVEDRPTNDVRGALGTLDLSARGLQDCPRLQGYIRLQVLDLSPLPQHHPAGASVRLGAQESS